MHQKYSQALSPQDEDLKQKLLQSGLLDLPSFEALWSQFIEHKREGLWKLAGKYCYVEAGTLFIKDFPEQELLAEIPLLETDEDEAAVSDTSSMQSQVLFVNSQNGQQIQAAKVTAPAILIRDQGAPCLVFDKFARSPLLALSNYLIDSHPPEALDHFDLYVSPDAIWLLVFHRESGCLFMVSLISFELEDSLQLLDEGSDKALNLAFDGSKIYITDNVSPKLRIFNLESRRLDTWNSGLGVLGNLCLAHSERLYLSVLSPQLQMLYFDLKTMQPEYSVPMQGQTGVQVLGLPQDCFQPTPSGKYLLFVSYQPEAPNSGLIEVINNKDVQVVKRYPLQAGVQPEQLVCTDVNPVEALINLQFEKFLIQRGILDADQLHQLKNPPPQAASAVPAMAPLPAPPLAPPAPRKAFRAHTPPRPAANILQLVNQPAEELELPPEADLMIVQLLVASFYQATLTNLEVHDAEMFRLHKIAVQARKKLVNLQAVMVSVPAILGQYTFETPISRQMVLEMLEKHQSNPSLPFKVSLCPECAAPLEEQDDCSRCTSCDFAFDTPAEQQWRAQLSAQSADFLPAGQMAFALPGSNQGLVLNPWNQTVQLLEGKAAWVQEFWSLTVLPDQSFLICDRKGKKVIACTAAGKRSWKAPLGFKQPVYATVYLHEEEERFLIVDQEAAQIVEINRKGKQLRKYPGFRTPAEALLKQPVYVQRTPEDHWLVVDQQRVLELDSQQQICWQVGAAQGLDNPIYACLLPDGQRVVVDKGLQQLLCFDPQAQQLSSLPYWPVPEHQAASPPEQVSRLHNGDFVFWGADYYFLYDFKHQRIRRFVPFPDLQQHKGLLRLAVQKQAHSLEQHKKHEQFVETLQTVSFLKELNPKHLQILAEVLTPYKLQAGETLLPDLGSAHAISFIVEGELSIYKNGSLLEKLEPGELVGSVGMLLAGGELGASVVATQETRLLQLNRSSFQKVLIRFPQLFQLLRKHAVARQSKVRRFLDEKTQGANEQLHQQIVISKARRHPLLQAGSEAFYQELAQYMRLVAYLPDQNIYGRNESGDVLYLINQGQVGVLRKGERQHQLSFGDGDVFGEEAFLYNTPRLATLRTLDYCRLYELEQKDFLKLSQNHPWLKQRLEAIAQERLSDHKKWQQQFRQQMGAAGHDLPATELWSPLEIREDELVYFPTMLLDLVVGCDNDGEIMWCCGKDKPLTFFQPYRSFQHKSHLYVCDTGHQRVIQLELNTRQAVAVWYNQSQGLEQPRSAVLTPQGNLLVADAAASRLLLLNREDQEIWSFEAPHEIMAPYYAELTDQNTILFADQGLHKVYEINLEGEVLWSYGQVLVAGDGPGELNEPAYAHRMPNGETLIADTGNDRLLLVSPTGQINAVYYGTAEQPLLQPKHCMIRENGDILVFSAQEERVVRLDYWGNPIWALQLKPAAHQLRPLADADSAWQAVFEAPQAPNPLDVLNSFADFDLDDEVAIEQTLVIQKASKTVEQPFSIPPQQWAERELEPVHSEQDYQQVASSDALPGHTEQSAALEALQELQWDVESTQIINIQDTMILKPEDKAPEPTEPSPWKDLGI